MHHNKEKKKLRIALLFFWILFFIIIIPLVLTGKKKLKYFSHFSNIKGEICWFQSQLRKLWTTLLPPLIGKGSLPTLFEFFFFFNLIISNPCTNKFQIHSIHKFYGEEKKIAPSYFNFSYLNGKNEIQASF